tara:strand:+ start:1841 stop:3811 length:1971 start_codon:yes stop_codon:yes gene_type:complete
MLRVFNSSQNFKKSIFLIFLFWNSVVESDNFDFNTYNNHGVVGLINTPTARFYDEGAHGITVYDGTPNQKITLSSNVYDWFEASFFYTNIQGVPYPGYEYQDYKDKGFNVKIRLKQEGLLPAIAVGLYDFAGTGLYSSEYIVASYGIKRIDMHFGLGWGELDGSSKKISNPLGYIHDNFKNRPTEFEGKGGQLNPSKYFSGEEASPFFGISYSLNDKVLFKFERDTTNTVDPNPLIIYEPRKSDYSFGLDYSINSNFTVGASYERGNYMSLRFTYKNNPKRSIKKYEYKKAEEDKNDNKYTKLINNLENNGIGVNKISEGARSVGLELTQFIHKDIRVIEEIVARASNDAGIDKNIKKDLKIADLTAYSEIDSTFERNSKLIYERDTKRRFDSNTGLKFRPFLASREEFFKGAFLIENDSELILKDNLFFYTNLKYSITNNFDDLRFPPLDVFPAQVRSDVKEYLKNMDNGILIGRAQLDFHMTPKKNHHIQMSAGIFEDMFSGYGMEYLYYKENSNYAFGLELFNVRKRDYDWGFGHLDYENTILNSNLYYRNYGLIPFDLKISAGEYLAGDVGATIEISRTYDNGVRFGAFATFTDVSAEDFGEGSFDKGLFFNIPIYRNFISYTWRPLTKDPGAQLLRKHTLHDLLVRFRPIN